MIELGEERCRALREHLLELIRRALPHPLQILDRDLKRKERVLQLMRQPPRQLAPGGHPFGLQHTLAMLDQLLGHPVEILG